jgi:hypothetical protein
VSTWGSTWGLGFPWGAAANGADWAEDLAEQRVLVQHPDLPGQRNFRDWIRCFASGLGAFVDVLDDLETAFNLPYAVGVQLDMIGAVVGLPRSGVGDTRYRALLEIQILLLLSAADERADWIGTHNNLLRIVRVFIGPGSGTPIVLYSAPPYSYLLSVPDVASLLELRILAQFLSRATYAAVLGQVVWIVAANSRWGSVHGAVADSGLWGSVHGAVAGSATWGGTVLIGA